MGGSGGGGTLQFSADELRVLREEAQRRLDESRKDAEINAYLANELIALNDRDTNLVNRRLEAGEETLEDTTQEFDRVLFGGSVAKHTYVDGLSDIDALVVLDSSVARDDPNDMRAAVERSLRRRLEMSDVAEISTGRMAVTVKYRDGMELQLLPAVERSGRLAVSSADGKEWAEIQPRAFSAQLSRLNKRQAGAVVPTIKLAKAIVAHTIEEEGRPSGYHMEALATRAFESYDGPRTLKGIVERFFDSASGEVLKPLSDVTGQSQYLDGALGPARSAHRVELGRRLAAIADRVGGARSTKDWRVLLGDEGRDKG